MTDDADGDPIPPDDAGAPAQVFRLQRRRLERRVPGYGAAIFRAPGADAEQAFDALLASGDPRAFANALIACCIHEPPVTAESIDGWSDRARAVARVAAAEVIGVGDRYRGLAASGRSGDERLLAAMQERRHELDERMRQLAATFTAKFAAPDLTRLFREGPIERLIRQQQQIDKLLRPPPYFAQLDRLSKQWAPRPGLFNGIGPFVHGYRPLAGIGHVEAINSRLARTIGFGTTGALARLHGIGTAFDSPIFRLQTQLDELRKMTQFTLPSGIFGLTHSRLFTMPAGIGTTGIASRLVGQIGPNYFGALSSAIPSRVVQEALGFRVSSHLGWTYRPPDLGFGRIFAGSRPFWLEGFRDRIGDLLGQYSAWLEREWETAKAQGRAPILFVIASLPALIGLDLLDELRSNDELLLGRLESALDAEGLADDLQARAMRSEMLDPIAKRHLTQGLEWVRQGRYIDAAPPLYQGLERAFRLTARRRGVIDEDNRFLGQAHRARMRSIEDVFRYLALDHLYVRFLHAWIFGEMGNMARHGDLPEDEHRRWVLRAVLAFVGWLEYVDGDADAVARLVAQLQLDEVESPALTA